MVPSSICNMAQTFLFSFGWIIAWKDHVAHANSCHHRQIFSACSGLPVGWWPLFFLAASSMICLYLSKVSSTGSRTFHQLFSSSERFFSVKISTILRDVLYYPSTGRRRTLLVLLTSSTSFWGVFCGIVPAWMIDCTNFVLLSFSWSWSLYIVFSFHPQDIICVP